MFALRNSLDVPKLKVRITFNSRCPYILNAMHCNIKNTFTMGRFTKAYLCMGVNLDHPMGIM